MKAPDPDAPESIEYEPNALTLAQPSGIKVPRINLCCSPSPEGLHPPVVSVHKRGLLASVGVCNVRGRHHQLCMCMDTSWNTYPPMVFVEPWCLAHIDCVLDYQRINILQDFEGDAADKQ